jgi:hypothetical protein
MTGVPLSWEAAPPGIEPGSLAMKARCADPLHQGADAKKRKARAAGIEPATSSSSGLHSSGLSYTRLLVHRLGKIWVVEWPQGKREEAFQ